MTHKELLGKFDGELIYLSKHGSQAYGTSTPTSDLDIRGVCIPNKRYLMGFNSHFEQFDQHEPDVVVFSLIKFFKLAADCNPNALEILFTNDEDHLFVNDLGKRLLANREMFLSKKAKHTFSGYAMSQLKRIKSHKEWLINPPKAPPTREQYGLPEQTVIPADQLMTAFSFMKKKVETWELDLEPLDEAGKIQLTTKLADILAEMSLSTSDSQHIAAGRSLGMSENFLAVLERERAYNTAQRYWTQYQEWKNNRNEARAKLEEKYGYDCKHGMHLVRLMRMCREILTTGQILVRRPDAEELLEIRNGAWSYERLIGWAEAQDKSLEEAYNTSTLPNAPNRKALDDLCIQMIEEQIYLS